MAERDQSQPTAGGLQPVDRAAAFAAGPGMIPRKPAVIFIACLLAIGGAGIVADHFFGGPSGSSAASSATANFPPPLQIAPAGGSNPAGGPVASSQPLYASAPALMGLQRLTARPAPTFTLVDQHGTPFSLSGLRGRVVVLTFFDSACDDICPVLATELAHACAALGSDASRVAIVVVNTDPLALTPDAARPAVAAIGSSPTGEWYFTTGTLNELNRVWKAYGIGIEMQQSTRSISHNNVMYFIDPSGRLRWRATPFADESRSGRYSLAPVTQNEWAAGIANQTRALLAGAR
jgi:protein SCO1/2